MNTGLRGYFAALVLTVGIAFAQSFDVASVKPHNPKDNYFVPMETGPGRFRALGFDAGYLIRWSYDVQAFQTVGLPAWVPTQLFDVEGTTDGQANLDQIKQMVQKLLVDRFKLKAHREAKEMAVYALTLGKGSTQIVESKQEFKPGERGQILIGSGTFRARGAMMPLVAAALSRLVGRPVVDETGLNAHYDFLLEYDQSTVSQDIPFPNRDPGVGASIFDAVQKGGLKLQARKGPIEMLVIDQLEKPEAN